MYKQVLMFFTLLLIQFSKCCSTSYKIVSRDIDFLSNSRYPWLVVIRDHADFDFRLSYGSLIHLKVVLTSALGIKGYQKSDLVVESNCQLDRNLHTINQCIARNVTEIMYQNTEISANDYAILVLKNPLPFHSFRLNPINLTQSISSINENDCFFTRWMREYSTTYNSYGLVKVSYKIPFRNKTIDVNNFNMEQLNNDRDWIISRFFHSAYVNESTIRENPMNFMGSPLVCPLRRDPEKYMQVGIAYFTLVVHTEKNVKKLLNIEKTGSFFNTIDIYKEIIEKVDRITQR